MSAFWLENLTGQKGVSLVRPILDFNVNEVLIVGQEDGTEVAAISTELLLEAMEIENGKLMQLVYRPRSPFISMHWWALVGMVIIMLSWPGCPQ